MPALMAVIGGTNDPLQKKLAELEPMAREAGLKMGSGLGSREASQLSVRPIFELRHALEKIAKGDFLGALRPLAMLGNHLGIVKHLYSSTAESAIEAAKADETVAEKAVSAAISSAAKAAASEAVLYAVGGETEANLAAAVSDEVKAAGDVMAAKSALDKAAASEMAAAAAKAEAVSFLTLGGFIAGVAALAIGAFLLWEYRVKRLADALKGVEIPDAVKRSPAQLSAVAEGWKRVADAVRDATEAMRNANAMFERNKSFQDQAHQAEKTELEARKKNALGKLAGNDREGRLAVLKEYAKKEHDLQVKQLAEDLKLQEAHVKSLKLEEEKKTKQATDLRDKNNKNVITEESENQKKLNLENASKAFNEKDKKTGKSKVDEAQDRLDSLNANLDAAKEQRRLEFGDANFKPYKLSDTEEAIKGEAEKTIALGKSYANRLMQFEKEKQIRAEARAEQKKLQEEAAKAAGDRIKAEEKLRQARELGKKIVESSDRTRQLEIEGEESKKEKIVKGQLTQYQKIGAYAAGSVSLIEVNKKMEHHLSQINSKIGARYSVPEQSSGKRVRF